MVVDAFHAMTVPRCVFTDPLYSASNVTFFVTSLIVKSPVILYLFPSTFSKRSLLNRISGNFSALKKLPDLRSLSRFVLSVLTLFVLITTSTDPSLKSSFEEAKAMLKSPKRPVTSETSMCTTVKLTEEWALSRFQFPSCANNDETVKINAATRKPFFITLPPENMVIEKKHVHRGVKQPTERQCRQNHEQGNVRPRFGEPEIRSDLTVQ